MFSSRLIRFARLDRLRRRDGVSDRAVALVFFARFTDEVLSGAWTVLAPTFRVGFRLSLVQVGFLSQILNWVALVVEPIAAVHIDLRERRSIMCLGAFTLAGSALVMGVAPNYLVLGLGFALFGLGSGPLACTADVVVVESFPDSAERAYSRATILDTVGALAGPGLVALAVAVGLSWRVVLVALGGCAAAYGVGLATTRLPRPSQVAEPGQRWAARLWANGRTVLGDAGARRWLLVLLCFDLFESAFVLKYIWLHDAVGLSQPLVALFAVGEQLVDLVALVLLDRWLVRRGAGQLFRAAATALIVLPTMWVVAPGVAGRVVVGVPLAFAHTLLWPLAKSQSLTAVPDLGGATQAITALFPLVPLSIVEARLATAVGIGPAMAVTATVGALLMLVAVGTSRAAPNPTSRS
ncbi:MAG: MFS transporter [Actinomycetota bacterium]|nr:MFS transporter [Actinomycetota bacterium]